MLIIALVLAVIGLTALVAAVVTSNELIAWVCIGASVIGVLLLIADALRSRRDGAAAVDGAGGGEAGAPDQHEVHDYPDEPVTEVVETVPESEPSEPSEPESEPEPRTEGDAVSESEKPETEAAETAGVSDTDGDPADSGGNEGGAVEISPDPEAPPTDAESGEVPAKDASAKD